MTKIKCFIVNLLFLTSCFLFFPSFVKAGVESTTTRKVFALSIGIDGFRCSETWQSAAKNDAVGLNKIFKNSNNILLLDSQATKQNILASLDKISRESTTNDIFIFTFAGGGRSYSTERLFYLLPFDSSCEEGENNGISSSVLREYFRRIRAKNKLIILDACNSSNVFEDSTNAFFENNSSLKMLNEENVLFIGTDKSAQERTFKDENGNETMNGIISRVVLDGLTGKADISLDQMIDSRELEAFIYKEMFNEKYQDKIEAEAEGFSYSPVNPRTGKVEKYFRPASPARVDVKYSPRIISRGEPFQITQFVKKTEKQTNSTKNKKEEQNNEKTSNSQSSLKNSRSEPILSNNNSSKIPEWKGESYAVLFANDQYDKPSIWRDLKNPQNDVKAIAKELRERYGFKEVEIHTNLSTFEIYEVIENLKSKKFSNEKEDQLFIFFAGHGVSNADGKGGYYVGRDSPSTPISFRNESLFVSLNGIMTTFDNLPIANVMVIFDACYAGKIWEPATVLRKQIGNLIFPENENHLFEKVAFSQQSNNSKLLTSSFVVNNLWNTRQDLSKFQYAKRIMKNKTRIIVTSGNRPVDDWFMREDGTKSDYSPFAYQFLKALQTNGGEDEVLTSSDYKPFIDKLQVEPTIGNLEGSDGDFAFVKREISNR